MKRNSIKKIIAVTLTLIMAISMISMTAFAAENPRIYVGLSYNEAQNALIATIKAKSADTQISGGAAFIDYDTSKLTADASSISLVQSGIKHVSDSEGCIGAAWYSTPPIEAGDSYTTIATIKFVLNEGVTLNSLDDSAISRCNDSDFLDSQGGYAKHGCGYIIDENNVDHSVSTDTLDFVIGEMPTMPETVAVTDIDITLDGALVSDENAYVTVGGTLDFDAPVYPANATDTGVSWTSSNPTVATVDENGVVTALTTGTTIITVTSNDGGFTDKCTVNVRAAEPENNIKSLADAAATTTVGTAPVLPTTVTATYDNGEVGTLNVTWEDIDPEQYSKAGTFEVKGTVAGTDIKAKCVVTVKEKQPAAPTITEIAPTKVSTFIGSIPKLPEKVTVTYSDDTTKSLKVTWNPVSADKYTEAGSFEIEGTVEGTNIKAKCTVTVKDPKEIVSVKASEVSTKVDKVPDLPKTVTVTYADDTTGKADVTWDKIDTAALSKAGTFTIKGTVKGTDIAAECKITVKKGSTGDPEKNDTPKTGESIVGIAIAGLIFLVSMMIMFMCAAAIKKGQLVKQTSANLHNIGGLMRFAPKTNRSRGRSRRRPCNMHRNNRTYRR